MTTATENRYIVATQPLGWGADHPRHPYPGAPIVELWQLGIPPDELPAHLPHLNLAQVFDALSYFSDHQDEIAAYIEQNRVPEEKIDPRVRSQ